MRIAAEGDAPASAEKMMFESLKQDLHFACRSLSRAKSFTAAAVLTLALGVAGTTVMFSLIRGVLLRPLPVHEQDRLIVAWKEVRSSGSAQYPFGSADIESVARVSQSLEMAAGVTRNGVWRSVMVDDGVSSYADVALVTGGFFDVLGVEPITGRTLAPGDDVEGAENVVAISSGFWHRRYGGSPNAIGRRVMLNEQPFTIVGVMPPDLDYPKGVEIWRTTSSVSTSGPFGDAARREVNLIGRLRPGVTVQQARSEITALAERLETDASVNAPRGLLPVVRPFAEVLVGDVRSALVALFAAVGLVLLIASANVANLLLLRGQSRGGDLAIRAALGARPGRIVGQLIAESVVIAMLAGVAGFAVGWWSLHAIIVVVPDGLPRVESIGVDATVIVFSIAVVLVTAVATGLAPAMAFLRADLFADLASGGRGLPGSVARYRPRALLVAQVALAVTVIAAAGLLIRSVLRLQSVNLGLPAERLVLVDLHLPQEKYAERYQHAQFLDAAITQLEAVPAILAATPVNISPFSGHGWDVPRFAAEGQSEDEAASNPSLDLESVHPNYFGTFEIPLVKGRAFTAADREGAMEVAIVSEDVAGRMWPDEDPIGKRMKMGRSSSRGSWYTIVGVAARTRYRELSSPRPTLYLPAAQFQMTATMLVLRTTAPLDLVASLARDRLRAVDADVQIMRVVPFTEMLNRPLARPRFNAFLLSVFGVAALLLTTVGVYAVIGAYVGQRNREIALRMALGATASRVGRFVLAETVRLAGLGVLIGMAASAAATRLLRGIVFEIDPLDPLTMCGAAFVMIVAAALASYFPVRRATRIDAATMLRN